MAALKAAWLERRDNRDFFDVDGRVVALPVLPRSGTLAAWRAVLACRSPYTLGACISCNARPQLTPVGVLEVRHATTCEAHTVGSKSVPQKGTE